MEQHIGFNDERGFERGKALTDEQRKHLKKCMACKMRVEATTKRRVAPLGPEPSLWGRFVSKLKSIFSKEKTS